ncbi:MAG: cytochrome c biogenesis heme-transporting ATPase CcmA [Proteobacteria bacterium]|nr:cytochrome c biogenesis heme-transporting ATPase CcmA [Pseudomonadota bacterium]
MLAAANLSLIRGGRQLFSGLSFEVAAGDLVQIEGCNGAGKTSLIRILAGLSRYGFEGEVRRSAAILYLGHHSAVKDMLSPRENLAWSVSGRGQYSIEEIDQALETVGLYGYEDVPSHALSAGQHRRVNLARLFLSDCPLWLLDEPFTAIDKAGVHSLEKLFVTHVRGGGAILLTSHQALALDYPVHSLALSTAEAVV